MTGPPLLGDSDEAIYRRAAEYIDRTLVGQKVAAEDRERAIEKVAAHTRKLRDALRDRHA